MVVRLLLTVPWVCLRFVIVGFPDRTHLLFFGDMHAISLNVQPLEMYKI